MASKRKVNQDDLRKMMAKVKTGSSAGNGSGPSVPKRYKISSREKALIEEQERQRNELKRFKEAQNKAALAKLPPAPSPNAKPQKSILKNTASYTPPLIIPSNISLSSKTIDYPNNAHTNVNSEFSKQTEAAKHFEDIDNCKAGSNEEITSKSEKTDTSDQASLETNAVESVNQNLNAVSSDLPEGFFDDPVQDAKARNVPFINVEEEEWEKFQKEIGEEMSTAQTILVEDREEATADRQIEEIDEQMEAWRRVSKMEQKKDQVNHRKHTALTNKKENLNNKNSYENSDSSDDEDYEEFVSWRKKK